MSKKQIWLISIMAAVILTTAILLILGTRKAGRGVATPPPQALPEEKLVANTTRHIKVFFLKEDSSRMAPVELEFSIPQNPELTYHKFVELLLAGRPGYIAPVPENASLLAAHFLKAASLLILDFNENVRALFPGGSAAEQEFVYFIVNNVCSNFPEVKKVAFLFGGNEQKELSGHLDMERAFYPDYSRFSNE